MLTVAEVANKLGVVNRTVYNWYKQGKINIHFESEKVRYISNEDFEKMKNELPKGMKKCRGCGKFENEKEFESNRMWCVECYKEHTKERLSNNRHIYNKNRRSVYHKNPYRYKSISKKNKYGITQEEFDKMVKDINNICQICGLDMKRPCLDHDHATLQIRGILCSKCNMAIGLLGDDYKIVESAANYLKNHELKFQAYPLP